MMMLAALWLALSPAAAAPPITSPDATLVLRFDGLAASGDLRVALFADEAAWNTRKQAMRSLVVKVSGAVTEARFTGLPPGSYAVMAYHDRNADGRLDTLPIGLPTEPYGFSNNARGVFGPPAWRAATVSLAPGATLVQAIRLH